MMKMYKKVYEVLSYNIIFYLKILGMFQYSDRYNKLLSYIDEHCVKEVGHPDKNSNISYKIDALRLRDGSGNDDPVIQFNNLDVSDDYISLKEKRMLISKCKKKLAAQAEKVQQARLKKIRDNNSRLDDMLNAYEVEKKGT